MHVFLKNWCYCHLLTRFLLGFAELEIFQVFCIKKQSTVRYWSLRYKGRRKMKRCRDVERKRMKFVGNFCMSKRNLNFKFESQNFVEGLKLKRFYWLRSVIFLNGHILNKVEKSTKISLV
jgi:hypothetical protein